LKTTVWRPKNCHSWFAREMRACLMPGLGAGGEPMGRPAQVPGAVEGGAIAQPIRATQSRRQMASLGVAAKDARADPGKAVAGI